MAHDPSSPYKFLVPDKSGTRKHDTLAKLLVSDSGASSLDEELRSWVIGLRVCMRVTSVSVCVCTCPCCLFCLATGAAVAMMQQIQYCRSEQ